MGRKSRRQVWIGHDDTGLIAGRGGRGREGTCRAPRRARVGSRRRRKDRGKSPTKKDQPGRKDRGRGIAGIQHETSREARGWSGGGGGGGGGGRGREEEEEEA